LPLFFHFYAHTISSDVLTFDRFVTKTQITTLTITLGRGRKVMTAG
jgi:hypothetical protein